jgi:pimeloyl-ACP methyl ester carboxylesterase
LSGCKALARAGPDAPHCAPLASRYCCVIYDRRNCGASDVLIGDEPSEQEIWADELAQLIRQIDIAPTYLGGWSAACRDALLTAIRHPELVMGLLLGWVTGGVVAAERLAHQYYDEFVEAAQEGGMQAVAETPFFAERIKMNPGNRDRLLGMDASRFIEVMQRWGRELRAGGDRPVIGATEVELAPLETPASIAAGDDDVHPTSAAENLHRLLRSAELHPPLISREEWDKLPSNE